MDKADIPELNHDLSVATLHSILDEAKHNSASGDVRTASEARRDFLVSAILLKLLATTDKTAFDDAEYPDLPSPEQLQAAGIDETHPITGEVPNAANTTNQAPAVPQPQNADALANQSNAGVTNPSDTTNETVTGTDTGQIAAENTTPNPAPTPNTDTTQTPDTTTDAAQLTSSDLDTGPVVAPGNSGNAGNGNNGHNG